MIFRHFKKKKKNKQKETDSRISENTVHHHAPIKRKEWCDVQHAHGLYWPCTNCIILVPCTGGIMLAI